MSDFVMIKLMPEEDWNVDQDRREDEPSEQILQTRITEVMQKDFREGWCQKADDGSVKPGNPGKPELEHFSVDNIDLEQYCPVRSSQADVLLDMVHCGYYEHQPMVFSPDLVYGYLAKGIATHVNKHAEALRHLYVTHDGKKKLVYRNDSFTKGDVNNDWGDMFQYFADELKSETSGNSIVQNDLKFSTSTRMTEAHRNVLAMESMKSYFEYEFLCGCGTACVILEGNEKDWELLSETINKQIDDINSYSEKNSSAKSAILSWWAPCVQILLENFLISYRSQDKGEEISENLKLWWGAIYKYNAGRASFGSAPFITGWINIFFPYLLDCMINPWVKHWAPIMKNRSDFYSRLRSVLENPDYGMNESDFGDYFGGGAVTETGCSCFQFLGRRKKYSKESKNKDELRITPSDFTSYLASVPFKWKYYDEDFDMQAVIGYTLLTQVRVLDGTYPKGTLKIYPAWIIYNKSG